MTIYMARAIRLSGHKTAICPPHVLDGYYLHFILIFHITAYITLDGLLAVSFFTSAG